MRIEGSVQEASLLESAAGDDLLGKLDEMWNHHGDDTMGKRSAFEKLTAAYLRTAPEYADQIDEVHLWHEWPDHTCHDHGIDIVARDRATT